LIRHSASPAVPEDWLAIDTLQGKRVKARISGFTPQINSGARIRDGDAVTTTGKPVQVSGALPEIEVKAMVPGARAMFIPSRFLEPIHPGGIQEEAIIISGEHLGKLAIVGSTAGPLWEVLVIDGEEGTTPIVVTTPRENLVKTTKHAFRRSTR
jgi:translation initiation factor IF-1